MAQSAHLTESQVASWLWAYSIASGITSIVASLRFRKPVITAWSTPGVAFLVTGLVGVPFAEAVGAFIVSNLLITLVGVFGLFNRVLQRIPMALAAVLAAVLNAGILISFGFAIFGALRSEPLLAGAMMAAFLITRRFSSRWAVAVTLLCGTALCIALGRVETGGLAVIAAVPEWTTPAFSFGSMISIAIPLTVLALTGQYLPGFAVLKASGYEPPPDGVVRLCGIASILVAPFGCHNVNPCRIAERHLDGRAGYYGAEQCAPLHRLDDRGRRYGVIEDPAGARAYVMEDRTIVLDRAPVSGFDSALLFLENGGVRADEKWRWHSVIGHDLFLLWMFQSMGIPEAVIAPDTSDALKVFRCWSFAIGGQHQLSSPALKIVTGTDYQSGRVQQAVGCRTVLGPATAYTETEIDRLAKMIRNFANRQGVFCGDTRSRGLERASGLYLHMTRIQDQVESEIRGYSEDFFRDVVFPERVLFPLRWLLQNAICLYAGGDRSVRTVVRERVFTRLLGSRSTDEALAGRSFEDKRDEAESLAEELISGFYPEIMRFYARTLADFLDTQGVARADYAWLLEDVEHSRNALIEKQAPIDPAVVWAGREFVIDHARGQVVGMQDGGR